MRPISLEDVLLVVSGQLVIDDESWSNDDEASLVASRKLRVLIADDAETNRIILSSMLEDAGHQVTCVENGLDLVASLKGQIEGVSASGGFDIVLTDIQMPLMDGITATQKIRSLEQSAGRSCHIPIVAVTAHAMNDEISRMRGCGVDDVVTKPIQPAELARVLTELAGHLTGDSPAAEQAAPELTVSLHGDSAVVSDEVANLQDIAYRAWRLLRQENTMSDFELLDNEVSFVEIFDIADVFMRSGESVRRTMLILRAFDSSFKNPLGELTQAKSGGDIDSLGSAAHALKGLLLDVGALTSGKLASTIETFCKEGRFEDAAALVTPLVNQVLSIAGLVNKISESASGQSSGSRIGSAVSL
jgi:CheY-like chemotaxis protein/HPt (histidine-containing phosphotransfer) domain-containing protein